MIPSLALPMSLLGAFPVMYLLGYSLDNLSLMALTLAVGFVVDDAIVMLENIVRHLEMGKPPMTAAIDGAREVGFTILSMTLSLTAVLIPIIFLGGIVGRLFREFAITIAIAILVSGLVSLTLTPMLASRFLRAQKHASHGRMYNATERAYEWLLEQYRWTLEWTMRRRRLLLAFSVAILVGTGVLFAMVKKGFIPTQDIGRIDINTEAAQGTSFDEMVRRQKRIAEIVQEDTNVKSLMSIAGGAGGASGAGASNTGRLIVALKPRKERPSGRVAWTTWSLSCGASSRASRGSPCSRPFRRRSRSAADRPRVSTSSRCRAARRTCIPPRRSWWTPRSAPTSCRT